MKSADVPQLVPNIEKRVLQKPTNKDKLSQYRQQTETTLKGIARAFDEIKIDGKTKGVDMSEEDLILKRLREELEAEGIEAAKAIEDVTEQSANAEVEEGLGALRNESVDRFARVFGLSPEVVKRVRKIPVIDDEEEFKAARVGRIQDCVIERVKTESGYRLTRDPDKRAIEDEAQKQARMIIGERDIDEEIKKSGGTYVQRANNTETIFIGRGTSLSEKEKIAHEVLHALSSRGFERGTGFREGPGQTSFLESRSLNEAATELLRVVSLMEDRPFFDVIDAIYDEKVQFGYKTTLRLLATILDTTRHKGGTSISFQTVADFYFNHIGLSASLAQDEFKKLLLKSVPEKHRDLVERLIPDRFTQS